ncbi:immunomodulatory protein [Armillaria mellea]|nr:immunomodulatory protein [Armillaria mellea]
MKFFSILALAFIPSYALATTVGWDSGYGVGTNSLANVACSNGVNGLLTKGFTTYSSLPTFPNISSSDSHRWMEQPELWELLAVDIQRRDGYSDCNRPLHFEFGVVQATATQVDPSACGL